MQPCINVVEASRKAGIPVVWSLWGLRGDGRDTGNAGPKWPPFQCGTPQSPGSWGNRDAELDDRVKPRADESVGWIASMRHIAIEAGAYVVSVTQYIPASAFPDDFPLELPAGVENFGRGGACIVSPSGEVMSGPLYDGEGIVYGDCDLGEALRAKRYFDVAGHYSRRDVLMPGHPEVPPRHEEA